jgi:hypothetical protein
MQGFRAAAIRLDCVENVTFDYNVIRNIGKSGIRAGDKCRNYDIKIRHNSFMNVGTLSNGDYVLISVDNANNVVLAGNSYSRLIRTRLKSGIAVNEQVTAAQVRNNTVSIQDVVPPTSTK